MTIDYYSIVNRAFMFDISHRKNKTTPAGFKKYRMDDDLFQQQHSTYILFQTRHKYLYIHIFLAFSEINQTNCCLI